jgi:hypothetical protein
MISIAFAGLLVIGELVETPTQPPQASAKVTTAAMEVRALFKA